METHEPLGFAAAVALEREGALSDSKSALMLRWRHGVRDVDTALGLAFLEWWSCAGPEFLTGLRPVSEAGSTEESVFSEIFDFVVEAGPSQEALFVLGWMCEQFPYCCGIEARDWESIGTALRQRYASSTPLAPDFFPGRSTFGRYFNHILATH
jgi:hypothetical protein